MEQNAKKKILIIGASACEYSLAQKFISYENVSEVFVAPGNTAMKDFATIVDIRETNVKELLEFALENAIDLTIVSSEVAIKNDIATVFQDNGQMIFAPGGKSAEIATSRIACRKFMYRNHIKGPKFAYFDKQAMACDYVNKTELPIVIKSDSFCENGVLVSNSRNIAKSFIDTLFSSDEEKILIEDYVFGHEFSFYVITDGYHALPIGSVATYKHELDGNGGVLSAGMGAFTPDYKISSQTEQKIMNQIVFPTLKTLSKQNTPYVGILGIDMILSDDEQLFAIKFNSFLKSPDAQCILLNMQENLYDLFQACIIGSFADDYDKIDISDDAVLSGVLATKKDGALINGLEELDENTDIAHFNTRKNSDSAYETVGGRTLVVSRKARVLSRAIKDVYEEIPLIKFDGIKYRTDIGQIIKM